MSQKCTAQTAAGQPCRGWAVHDSDPPLCAPHAGLTVGAGAPPGNQNRRTHGFYSRTFERAEIDDLVVFASCETLDDEIACARVALRRVFRLLLAGTTPGPEPTPLAAPDYLRLVALAFQGTRTVARLLRDRHELGDDDEDGISTFMAQALDELSEEWGIDL
jgi:hypothetical protein